jgi:arginase
VNNVFVTPYFLDQKVERLAEIASERGWQVNDVTFAGESEMERLGSAHRPIADFVSETLRAGETPISFNGDCCAAIGVLAGLQRAGVAPRLLWLDAHGDFNTFETTPSNFLGGMPLAMMVGIGNMTMMQGVAAGVLSAENVIAADLRDLDPGERLLVESSAIRHVERFNELYAVDWQAQPLWIHFDVDVLNLEEMNAVSYPAQGGVAGEQLAALFEQLRTSANIVAISVSAWNPRLDPDRSAEKTVMALVDRLLRVD